MKVRQLMTPRVIRISPEESVAVAARTLARYNVGALPVCGVNGSLQGMVTDRDLVIRCLATGRSPEKTTVREVMSGSLFTVAPELDAGAAAMLMAKRQVRRLPVVENGTLCGMLSLGDLAQNEESACDAGEALSGITNNLSSR